MFSGLLIGQTGWYSRRCALRWKLKGTKYNRLYFQLYPSTPRTEGTECGLLPTPESFDWNSARHPELWEKDKKKYAEKGVNLHCNLRQQARLGLLPTPTAMDSTGATANMKSSQVKEGSMHSVTLSRMILQTPRASDKNIHWKTENWKGDDLGSQINEMLGTRSHLSPQFVLEMMGFPTELDGITFSKWRNESIKGGGNAVVPQVVLQIFKAIEEYESKHTS